LEVSIELRQPSPMGIEERQLEGKSKRHQHSLQN